ncbi:MAG: methionyl-tRNA synthetase [Gammaproteobacteria bacterium]|jgi:methionyl-tRNA synthetase
MTTEKRNILVTSALPYANGPIHIGHLVEYLQTDIWVRFQKMRGHNCYYVCADDAHGTPIMLRAEQEGITPEALIERISAEHQRDFARFDIEFDNYHSTHSSENKDIAELIYGRLNDGGHIVRKTITQAYDPVKKLFLPDRFLRGTCPHCGAEDQYGDSCESCSRTYSPNDLLNPVSALSGATPEQRESEHLFFKLGHFEEMLKSWLADNELQPGVVNKLNEWFEAGLQDWDISREAPYFGFEIPGEPGKYFYVWLDAPIGYLASFKNLCEKQGIDFDAYVGVDSTAEMYHFIGKDIMYFHTLFWPAMLSGAQFRVPTNVFVHGFLTVDGQKMSKSRGTFVTASTYLEYLNPEYLRYYFAAKLAPAIEDIDLNLSDFQNKVNSDLVGKVVNIASRCAGFIQKRFDGTLSDTFDDPAIVEELKALAPNIAQCYESRDFARAMREIMMLADLANQYIDKRKPWIVAKQTDSDPELHRICTTGIALFRILLIYLRPVLPVMSGEAEKFLNDAPLVWDDIDEDICGRRINKFKPLMQRVETEKVEAMIDASKNQDAKPSQDNKEESKDGEFITIDDFAKIDLRVAKVLEANTVEGADKLLQLKLEVGDETRTVFAGIKSAYQPDTLIGRHVIVVANLQPRKMRFGLSEGMVLAAGPGGEDLFLLGPDSGAVSGMRAK